MKVVAAIFGFITLVSSVKGEHVWSEIKYGYEGLIEVGVYVLKDCLRECLYLVHCKVVAFDNSTKKCYIQMELDLKPVAKNQSGTLKTYELKRDEFYNGDLCWKKIPGKKIKGLTNAIYDTLTLCVLYCIGSRRCNSITYDTSAKLPCWLQLANEVTKIDGESLEPSTTADSFILDKPCMWQIQFLPE